MRNWIAVYLVMLLLGAAPVAFGQSSAAAPDQGSAGSTQMTQSEAQAKARLESAGYTDVTVNAGAEVTTARAVKNGKKFEIVIDSFGKIIAKPAQP